MYTLLVVLILVYFGRSDGPMFPSQFQVPYIEYYENFNPSYTESWDVMFYYDSVQIKSRTDLKEGQNDGWCRSAYDKDVECRQIVNGDWRYFVYPSVSNKCCKCCNKTSGCGILSPDWIVKDSKYVGYMDIEGVRCQGWMKKSEDNNYYFVEPNKPVDIPCAIIMNSTTVSLTYLYNRKELKFGAVDPSVFDIPDDCDDFCDGTCKYFR